jgi:hypothetical protein
VEVSSRAEERNREHLQIRTDEPRQDALFTIPTYVVYWQEDTAGTIESQYPRQLPVFDAVTSRT